MINGKLFNIYVVCLYDKSVLHIASKYIFEIYQRYLTEK